MFPRAGGRGRKQVFLAAVVLLVATAFVLMLVARLGRVPTTFSGTLLEPPMPAAPFELRNQRDETFRLADARGKVVVLTFLYTRCVDVCPFIAVKLKRTMELLGDVASQVEVVVVSTDPVGDTPEQVAAYSREFGMYDRWHYLLGTREQLEPVWRSYFVGLPEATGDSSFASDAELRLYGLTRGLDDAAVATANRVRTTLGGGPGIGHTTPVWLIDPGQNIRVKHGQDLEPSQLASDIRNLLRKP